MYPGEVLYNLHLFAFVKHTARALFERMKSNSIGFQLDSYVFAY